MAKSISRNAHYIIAFKNPRDQLSMKNVLPYACPTCWQDMMDGYQKVGESLKNTASIFAEILIIQYFTILVANLMTSSLS